MFQYHTFQSVGRTPQGVRGLKQGNRLPILECRESHSARSAWIETFLLVSVSFIVPGRTPQGVRGLKLLTCAYLSKRCGSHSARSAWIETVTYGAGLPAEKVALRKECVD